MPNPDRFIAFCTSWDDFYERTKALPTSDKGAVFERLTQLYLQTTPEYRTKLQHVWLLREVPADIRKRLNLPGPDEGIDLIARTQRGKYWAIQTKFRSQRDKPLNRRELGTFTSLAFASFLRQHRPFKKARAFVRRLGLKSRAEWNEYCRSGKKPADIPNGPYGVYAEAGWVGMDDWLGTGRVAPGQHRPFKKARAFVRRLGLKSGAEWNEYCRSGKKPADIPSAPQSTYAKAGWTGVGDWLGTGRVSNQLRQHRPFKKARAFVRGLDLKSHIEWLDYCKSGKRPTDIPANPYGVYAEDGWSSWGDWLGNERGNSGTRAQANGVGMTR